MASLSGQETRRKGNGPPPAAADITYVLMRSIPAPARVLKKVCVYVLVSVICVLHMLHVVSAKRGGVHVVGSSACADAVRSRLRVVLARIRGKHLMKSCPVKP